MSKNSIILRAQRGERLLDALPPGPTPRVLTDGERYDVVDTFIRLIEGLYVHLPLKRAMYGKDPVQRLRLLRQRVPDLSEPAFHEELGSILTDMRDAHTRYVGPQTLQGRIAVLPFMVEEFGNGDGLRFTVSNLAEGDPAFAGTAFEKGVELLFWNGVPMDRAVDRHADRETGGRPDARRARALDSLTFRALQYGPPPDEYWVDIRFRTPSGAEADIRFEWRIVEVSESGGAADAEPGGRGAFAADPAAEAVRRAKQLLFAPDVWYQGKKGATAAIDRRRKPEADHWISGHFQDNVAAKLINTPAGSYGYLRLWSFDLIDDEGFLQEVISLLEVLPDEGLIIDLRGNPGGLIWAAERLLQLFTPHPVAPTKFSLLATDLTRAMADAPQNEVHLEPWRRSLTTAVISGEPYSRAVPLTPPRLCNNIGQRYGGPVVAVVDANTYSAGDLFAAGFVDNRLGTLISAAEATGAGGANVWYPNHVSRALAGTRYEHRPLPHGIGYTIAVRRALRTGSAEGVVIEDLGVPGHLRYDLTYDDLTGDNVDLLDFCGRLLASESVTGLEVEVTDLTSLHIVPRNLDRIDIIVDERPSSSEAADQPVDVELPAEWFAVEVAGFTGATLRQRRLLRR